MPLAQHHLQTALDLKDACPDPVCLSRLYRVAGEIWAAPASVEYRLYHGDERMTMAAIETRLSELGRSTAAPIAYRRVVGAFLREELRRLAGPSV